jgi:hypothetical protein
LTRQPSLKKAVLTSWLPSSREVSATAPLQAFQLSPATNNKKSDERDAFEQACWEAESRGNQNNCERFGFLQAWLLRKQRNLKTGKKTDPAIKSLLHILVKPEMAEARNESSQSSGSKGALAAPPAQPVRRHRKKEGMQQKEEAGEAPSLSLQRLCDLLFLHSWCHDYL